MRCPISRGAGTMVRNSGKGKQRLLDRRSFLGVAPAAMTAGLAVPATAHSAVQPTVATDAITAAEELAGLDFTADEHMMMLNGLDRNRERYDDLRALEIPLDTEPAVTFRAPFAGHSLTGVATPHATIPLSKQTLPPVGTPVEELAFLPVTTLAELIRQQRISSTELTMMYLSRLKRYGDSLKCVVTLTEELALDQAARADTELRNGKNRGPLHGIPWGAKDLLATKGVRTTWGAKPYETQIIDHDATVVERLNEAGAVLVAKLSMGALAQGGVWFGGSTRNPWNLARSSSGSSAGPGAATAAGLVGFSIGTETRGSIISPSAACGVTGLRPTYGRVSRYGAMALSWTMDKIGPMCRSVEDCALVFNEIYGSDGRDNSVIDAPFDWSPDGQLADLRIGYIQREFEEPPANASEERRQRWEVQQPALAAALESLRGAGAILDPIEMPDFPTNAISFILTAEAAAAFDDLTRSRGIDRLTSQESNAWPNTFRTARFIPAVEYIRAQRARTLLMRRMNDLMSEYDVFISPSRSNSLGITNLTGHPAIAVKAGFADEMPVSLMITGRLFEEATILRAALAFERATPWHTQHPAL